MSRLSSPLSHRSARVIATALTALAALSAVAVVAWLVWRAWNVPEGPPAPPVPPPDTPVASAPPPANAPPPSTAPPAVPDPPPPVVPPTTAPAVPDPPRQPFVWARKDAPPAFQPEGGDVVHDERVRIDGRRRELRLAPGVAVLHDRSVLRGALQCEGVFRFSWDEPPALLVPGRAARLTLTGGADVRGRKDAAGSAEAYLRVVGGRAVWRAVEGDAVERGFLDGACHLGTDHPGASGRTFTAARAVYQIDAAPEWEPDDPDELAVEVHVEGTDRGLVSYSYERKEVTEMELQALLGKPDPGKSP